MKLRGNLSSGSGGVECGRTDRRTETEPDMTKLMVAFGNFANAPKNVIRDLFIYIYTRVSQ